MSTRQTNGWVPSRKDSGCSAESIALSLLTPWNSILLFRVEKQIFTAVFSPHPWPFLQRKALGTCQQTAGHGHPSSKCHLHAPQPLAQAEFKPLALVLQLALRVCDLMKELTEKVAGYF